MLWGASSTARCVRIHCICESSFITNSYNRSSMLRDMLPRNDLGQPNGPWAATSGGAGCGCAGVSGIRPPTGTPPGLPSDCPAAVVGLQLLVARMLLASDDRPCREAETEGLTSALTWQAVETIPEQADTLTPQTCPAAA